MPAPLKILTAFITLAALAITGPASAALLTWTYSATVSIATGADSLGIDGQSLSISLTFDDTSRWTTSAGWLYAVPTMAGASMSGPHTLSLSTSDVAAAFGDDCCAAIVEAVGSRSYVDLIVDGHATVMSGNGVSIVGRPKDGDVVAGTHLPISLETFSFFEYEDLAGSRSRYDLVRETIAVAEHSVPEPGSVALSLCALLIAFAVVQVRLVRRSPRPN